MTERDDLQEQSQTVAETTATEQTTVVGETPTDPAEEKRVETPEVERTETVTETVLDGGSPSGE